MFTNNDSISLNILCHKYLDRMHLVCDLVGLGFMVLGALYFMDVYKMAYDG